MALTAEIPDSNGFTPMERRVIAFARALGFRLIRVDVGRWAMLDMESDDGRLPATGGYEFQELVRVLKRRNLGDW